MKLDNSMCTRFLTKYIKDSYIGDRLNDFEKKNKTINIYKHKNNKIQNVSQCFVKYIYPWKATSKACKTVDMLTVFGTLLL